MFELQAPAPPGSVRCDALLAEVEGLGMDAEVVCTAAAAMAESVHIVHSEAWQCLRRAGMAPMDVNAVKRRLLEGE